MATPAQASGPRCSAVRAAATDESTPPDMAIIEITPGYYEVPPSGALSGKGVGCGSLGACAFWGIQNATRVPE